MVLRHDMRENCQSLHVPGSSLQVWYIPGQPSKWPGKPSSRHNSGGQDWCRETQATLLDPSVHELQDQPHQRQPCTRQSHVCVLSWNMYLGVLSTTCLTNMAVVVRNSRMAQSAGFSPAALQHHVCRSFSRQMEHTSCTEPAFEWLSIMARLELMVWNVVMASSGHGGPLLGPVGWRGQDPLAWDSVSCLAKPVDCLQPAFESCCTAWQKYMLPDTETTGWGWQPEPLDPAWGDRVCNKGL